MIRDEISRLKTGPAELRKFGWLVGGILTALGLWFYWRGRSFGPSCLVAGVLLIAAGSFWPRALRRVYVPWMALALLLGLIVSTTLLTLFFYFVVTPIGWTARVLGKDFLSRKWRPEAKSYWIPREPEPFEKKRYEQQF